MEYLRPTCTLRLPTSIVYGHHKQRDATNLTVGVSMRVVCADETRGPSECQLCKCMSPHTLCLTPKNTLPIPTSIGCITPLTSKLFPVALTLGTSFLKVPESQTISRRSVGSR